MFFAASHVIKSFFPYFSKALICLSSSQVAKRIAFKKNLFSMTMSMKGDMEGRMTWGEVAKTFKLYTS